MATDHSTDYRETLRDILASRCQSNPRYSLRAFARDLKLSPSRLSEVLNGRYGLSRAAAIEVAERLGLNRQEQEFFRDQVEARHARARKQREAARARITATHARYHGLSLDAFKVISDWYHFAILELMQIEGFRSDPAWIAKALGISSHAVRGALERLKRLELIEERRGELELRQPFNATPSGIPSEAIRKFHEQILEKAARALHCQSVEERDFSSVILSVDREQLREARAMIRDFRRSFDRKFGGAPRKNSVYCLGVQFFRLTEEV